MPQATLMDLNTSAITYRKEIIMNLKSKNYAMCFGALNAINGILFDQYRVKVSTAEYKLALQNAKTAACAFCTSETFDTKSGKSISKPTEHDYYTLKFYSLMLPNVARILADHEYDKVWDCPKCGKSNKLKDTKIFRNTLQKPYFLKVVPDAPERKDGIMDRSTYDKKIKSWILDYLGELEHQMALQRIEYIPKGGETTDDLIEVDSDFDGDMD